MPAFDHITHILFDLDGLLIDSEPLWEEAEDHVLLQYVAVLDPAIRQAHIGLRLDEAAQVMVEGYGLRLSVAELEALILDEMFALLRTRPLAMSGADEVLRACHAAGYPIGIASSSRLDYIQTALDRLNWSPMVRALASAYETPRGKPAPDVYLLGLERLGAAAETCLALEDSTNGARAAYAAGLTTVAIPGSAFDPATFTPFSHHQYPDLSTFVKDFLS